MKKEFVDLLLGPVSVAQYLAAEVFALIALVIGLWLHSRKRDPKSPNTPEQFSWEFLLWDNTKRIFIGQLLLFLFFRFTTELMGKNLNMYMAVAFGFFVSFGLDRAIVWLQKKTDIFDRDRTTYKKKTGPEPVNNEIQN